MITAAEFRHGCCGQGTPVEIRCDKAESSSVPPVNRSRIASCGGLQDRMKQSTPLPVDHSLTLLGTDAAFASPVFPARIP